MEQAIQTILELIKSNITDPLFNAISSVDFFNNFIAFINKLLNGILNIASDRDLTNVEYINLELIADIIGILFFIWFIVLVVGIFSFTFKSLKNAMKDAIQPKAKQWRTNWKRRKRK